MSTDIIPVIELPNGGYSVHIPKDLQNVYGRVIKCSDIPVQIGETIVVNEYPKIEIFKKINIKIKARSNVSELNDLSIKEYEDRKFELQNECFDNSDPEYKVYKSLEHEYKYKKFLESYTIETEIKEVKECDGQTRLEVMVPFDDPFITPLRHIGENITNFCAVFKRHEFLSYLIKLIMINFNIPEKDTPEGKNSNISYKLYDHNQDISLYINGREVFKKNNVYNISDEYNKILEIQNVDKNTLISTISNSVKSINTTPNVAQIINELNSIHNIIKKIDVKVRSYDDYRTVVNKISKFIEKLTYLDKTYIK